MVASLEAKVKKSFEADLADVTSNRRSGACQKNPSAPPHRKGEELQHGSVASLPPLPSKRL
jgi:hypothetical protein